PSRISDDGRCADGLAFNCETAVLRRAHVSLTTDYQPIRPKNSLTSSAARSGSSRCGKWPTPGNSARSRLLNVSPSLSVQAKGLSGSCSGQRTHVGTSIGG